MRREADSVHTDRKAPFPRRTAIVTGACACVAIAMLVVAHQGSVVDQVGGSLLAGSFAVAITAVRQHRAERRRHTTTASEPPNETGSSPDHSRPKPDGRR